MASKDGKDGLGAGAIGLVNGSTVGSDHARTCPAGLTRNEKHVWEVLAVSSEALKAYEILDKLKDQGIRAPMTIYRALDGLEEKGIIHKLEGMNAFVLCTHDGPHPVQTFLVCEDCATVKEVELGALESDVVPAVRRAGFDMHIARLEIKGLCSRCVVAHANH